MTQLEKIEKIAERATATIFLNAQWIAHLAETLDDNGLYDDIVRQFVEHARSENRQAFNSISESINELRKQAQADGDKGFNPDWSELEAARASLREHQALAKAAQEREQQFRTAVADALAKLRNNLERIQDREWRLRGSASVVSTPALLSRVDATIAALGLSNTEKAK